MFDGVGKLGEPSPFSVAGLTSSPYHCLPLVSLMTSCDILSIVKRNQDGEVHMFSKVYLCHDDANFAHPRCDRNLGFPTPNVSFFVFWSLDNLGLFVVETSLPAT